VDYVAGTVGTRITSARRDCLTLSFFSLSLSLLSLRGVSRRAPGVSSSRLEVRSRSVAGCLHGLRGRERTTRGEPWRFLWIFRRDNKDHRLAGCVGAVWSRLCRACSTGKVRATLVLLLVSFFQVWFGSVWLRLRKWCPLS
jgi:hypothetical protein